MTLAEVEQIFGQKAQSIDKVVRRIDVMVASWITDDESLALIWFSPTDHDCITEKEWYASNETTLDKIRRWLHLR
jgi:hypothetical protein